MSYTVEKFPNERIVLQVLHADYSYGSEGAESANAVFDILEAQNEPIYLIMDIREAAFSMEDILQGSSSVMQQRQLLKHPNIIENIIVTESRFMKLVVQGFNSPVFGNVNVRVFDSRDAAIAYARTQAAAKR
jgi:hypothetical protein